MIKEGVEIFASSPGNDEAADEAKRYIKRHGLTSDDVKIVTTKDRSLLAVITKREIELKFDGEAQDGR